MHAIRLGLAVTILSMPMFGCDSGEKKPPPECRKHEDCKATERCWQRECIDAGKKIEDVEVPTIEDRIAADCYGVKTEILNKCRPGCEANPNLMGEAFDDCLRKCSEDEFNVKMPTCTK